MVYVSEGPAYFIPVRVSKDTPTMSNKLFEPGTATLINSRVEVNLALDFLVIVAG
jgi:hypothetical protein